MRSRIDDAQIEPLFNDTLNKLEADAISRQIDVLTARERESGLNPAERRQLAELLLHKQKLRVRAKVSDS